MAGAGPFDYQWLRNGQVIVPFGQGDSSLTIPDVQLANAGAYSVVVSDAANLTSVRSDEATLNVLGPLTIVEPPPSVSVQPGATVQLRVTAAGRPPIRYQWTLNGKVLPDETNALLVLPRVDAKSGGNYQVVVWNKFDEAIVTPQALVLVRASTNANSPADKFADRPRFDDFSAVLQGNSAQARREPGEPIAPGGGQTVWIDWTAPDSGIATFTSRGSTFDTFLTVFTGVELNNLAPAPPRPFLLYFNL